MSDFWQTVWQMLWISMIAGFVLVGIAAGLARWYDNRRWREEEDE